jgi:hypothetical protein
MKRRQFIKNVSQIAGGAFCGSAFINPALFSSIESEFSVTENIYIAKNGTPAENVAKVLEMRFGGVENFIGHDDVVVINPNGQWPNQGGSNCACCMGLIELILNRPGGFNGEILFVENTQFSSSGYWTATGTQLDRNGPYNFNDMISYYQNGGHSNVSGVRLRRNMDSPDDWPIISTALEGQGWVRPEWASPTTGCVFYLPYPVIRSPYSDRLVDLKDGVYESSVLTATGLKFIKMPNLNNHGWDAQQDYAGVTSATKSFLGIAELENDYRGPFLDGHKNMHTYHDTCHGNTAAQKAFAAGQAVGAWMKTCRKPDICLTTAEWVGWESRYGVGATNTKTVGLALNPSTLDYYMCKYVLWPTHLEQQYFNPDYNIAGNMTRQTIDGCISEGHGTANEDEMAAFIYDFDRPTTFRFEIDRMIRQFREGTATEQQVLDLIESYNEGN